jgi:gliding motility-associated-like protein
MSTIAKYSLVFCAVCASLLVNAQAAFEFVENKGQWQGNFIYKSSTGYSDVYLRQDGITFTLKDATNRQKVDEFRHGHTTVNPTLNFYAYKMNFVGALHSAILEGKKPQKYYYNYFLGNDQSKWASELHPCMVVNYNGLYKGIDLHLYNEGSLLKYDLLVAPNADISQIKFEYEGLQSIAVRKNKLYLKTSLGENEELEPYAYQFIDGEKVQVACNYVLTGNVVSFKLGKEYDKSLPITIDPTLVFCTFTGSSSDNWGYTATPGINGEFYAGGIVAGTGYPVTTGAYQATWQNGTATSGNGYACDIGISKFTANGANLIYATYLGGTDNDQPHSIIEDASGNLVVMGRSYSTNYPTSTVCYDNSSNGGADVVVTKLNSAGTALVGSTYLGGNADDCVNFDAGYTTFNDLKYFYGDDSRSEVIIDAAGNILIANNTKSSNFPVTTGAYQTSIQGGQDGTFSKLDPTLATLQYSTFLGGSGEDGAYVLHIDKNNANTLFVGGGTKSTNFPTTAGTLHTSFQGGTTDGFLCKFNLATSTLIASTYIGTNAYDQVFGINDDNAGNVYIMGHSMGSFPVSAGVYSNTGGRHFVQCLDNALATSIRSTRFGTNSPTKPNLSLNAFLVDTCGNIYISGWGDGGVGATTTSGTTGLTTTAGAIQTSTDGGDFYFIVFTPNLATLLYASFYGQNGTGSGGLGAEHVDGGTSRFDVNGAIYQAICANCGKVQTFPTTAGAYSTTNTGNNCNLAALKISFDFVNADAVAGASPFATGCAPLTVNFTNNSANATSYWWDLGNGSSTTQATPTATYSTPGTYTVQLVAINNTGCALTGSTDTAQLLIVVTNDTIKNDFTLSKIDSCITLTMGVANLSTFYGNSFGPSTSWLWSWGDGNTSTVQNPGQHVYANTGTYNVTLTITDTNACNSPVILSKGITFINNYIDGIFTIPPTGCAPFPVAFVPTTSGIVTGYNWYFGDGGTSTSSTPNHTYSTYGNFTAMLVVSNPNSCNKTDTSYQTTFVSGDILANFSYVKQDTCEPYIISVSNASSTNPALPNAGNWTTYSWNWGDGSANSSGQNPGIHVYNTAGTYTITLTMTDSTSCNNPQTVTKVVNFIDNNVRAVFDMPDTVCQPYTHIFNNGSSNVTTYAWQFGDGSNSANPVPTHTFGTLGTFTVNLITVNPSTCNLIDSAKQVITVVESPVANFSYAPFPPLPNKPVTFTNSSTGATSYIWDFGDGTGSTEVNPIHLYNKSSETQVCLTAINEYGCQNKKCIPISPRVTNVVDVPTGFTPNGDGINDEVMVKGYGIQNMIFRIYNRWGELVFEADKPDVGWNGIYKGAGQEMDAFAYTLQVTFTDGSLTSKKGNITLIR